MKQVQFVYIKTYFTPHFQVYMDFSLTLFLTDRWQAGPLKKTLVENKSKKFSQGGGVCFVRGLQIFSWISFFYS